MDIKTDKLLILNSYLLLNNIITKEEYDKINAEIEASRRTDEINVENMNLVSYNVGEPASFVS